MPLTNISGVRCKVFAVNFLKNEEYAHVQKLWSERFATHTAFFVQGNAQQKVGEIAQSLCDKILKQGITNLDGESVILAYFIDITEDFSEDRIRDMATLPQVLTHALHCNITVTLQFAYVGKLAFSSAAVQRRNAQLIVEENSKAEKYGSRRQLCLVASPTLGTEEQDHWKSVFLFLDLLRRQTDATSLLPATNDGLSNNDIGFLSYGEHSASQMSRLDKQIKQLTELLSNRGGDRLRQAMEQRLVEIERELKSIFQIDTKAFPLHPGMLVEDTFFSKNRKKAQKGKYDPYNEARASVLGALTETARKMEQDIKEQYARLAGKAKDELYTMLNDSELGIELLENSRDMLNYLSANVDPVPQPYPPALRYQPQGSIEEITEYLQNTLVYHIVQCKISFVAAIKEAYSAMDAEEFRRRRIEYTRALEQAKLKRSAMCGAEEFYSSVITGVPRVHSDFHPVLPNGKQLYSAVVRGEEMLQIARKMEGAFTQAKCFTVNEKICGTPKLDDAPMKVLGVMFKDCTEENLLDLMPEVQV